MYFLYGAILFSMQCRSQCLTPMARPDTDIENAAYYIDYVKVYQKNSYERMLQSLWRILF